MDSPNFIAKDLYMQQYKDELARILSTGKTVKNDRTGVGTVGIFHSDMSFDLRDGLPILTLKKTYWRQCFEELRLFLNGISDNNILKKNKCTFWDKFALPEDHTVTNDAEPWQVVASYASVKGISTSAAMKELSELDLVSDIPAATKYMVDNGASDKITKVIYPAGYLGPIYPTMWRNWPASNGTTIDQIAILINNLSNIPDSRRHVVCSWNPEYLPDESIDPHENIKEGKACLAYCHPLFQFHSELMTIAERIDYVVRTGWECATPEDLAVIQEAHTDDSGMMHAAVIKALADANVPTRMLSCGLYARSQDWCLGTPMNILSYSMFTHMLAHQLGHAVGWYHHTSGNAHVYLNHVDNANVMLDREPLPLPRLKINVWRDRIEDYVFEDFELVGYESHPALEFECAF